MKHKIGVGFTTNNHLYHEVVPASAFKAMSGRDWSDYHFEVYTKQGIYIEANRNDVAAQFLNHGVCDYLWFIDYDNGFFPEALEYFMEDMQRDDVHIVQGMYYCRHPKPGTLPKPTCGMRLPTTTPHWGWDFDDAHFIGKEEGLINLSKDNGSRNGAISTGMLMIKKQVFMTVPHPWFETRWLNGSFFFEDVDFGIKCQEAGYDLWVDTRIHSAHMTGKESIPPEWRPY